MDSKIFGLPFFKYSGCGNDFVIVDGRRGLPLSLNHFVPEICHRRRGIGADGVILLSTTPNADISMRIFNADGSEAAQCGNGLRCVARCMHDDLEIPYYDHYHIQTSSGLCRARFVAGSVEVAMNDSSPITGPYRHEAVEKFPIYAIQVGVPHAVVICDEIEDIAVEEIGRIIRFAPLFRPEGANVNFIKINSDGESISIRTYERGVEAETDACGTGGAASAIVAAWHFKIPSPISVFTHCGDQLVYQFETQGRKAARVTMRGDAQRCYEGVYSLSIPSRYSLYSKEDNDHKEQPRSSESFNLALPPSYGSLCQG